MLFPLRKRLKLLTGFLHHVNNSKSTCGVLILSIETVVTIKLLEKIRNEEDHSAMMKYSQAMMERVMKWVEMLL